MWKGLCIHKSFGLRSRAKGMHQAGQLDTHWHRNLAEVAQRAAGAIGAGSRCMKLRTPQQPDLPAGPSGRTMLLRCEPQVIRISSGNCVPPVWYADW